MRTWTSSLGRSLEMESERIGYKRRLLTYFIATPPGRGKRTLIIQLLGGLVQ